jgi:predicted TIM-barrel fold metal-dependent hydrolase
MLDGHIHIREGDVDGRSLLAVMNQAGMEGGLIISLPPWSSMPAPARLDNLMRWTAGSATLFPFFWIDPLEPDAGEQVEAAVERQAAGFKVICDHFPPGDPAALEVYRRISAHGRPILFHSGILWDGKASAPYNHPEQFEPLLEVANLRFSLAHISWPWCDELIAVYGKFLNARTSRPELSAEMYVDLTPGTPPIYRREALTKLFTVGYDVGQNAIFGSDCYTVGYNGPWTREWVQRDNGIYDELGLEPAVRQAVFGENLKRFLGLIPRTRERVLPRQGE